MFIFFISSVIFTIFFLYIPHTVELTGVLETWFPYKGLILYKDISMFHFPLGRLPLVPLHIFSNWDLRLDPFLGFFVGLASLCVIYLFGKKYLTKLGTSAALLFFTIFYWYFSTAILYFHEQLIGLILAIALLIFYKIQKKGRFGIKNIFLLGLTLSLAEFTGQIATITVFVFSLIVLYKIFKQKKPEIFLKPFFFGLVIPFLLLCIYFFSKNALNEFLYWNTIYYITYSGFVNTPLSFLPWRDILAFYLPLAILVFYPKHRFLTLIGLSTIPFIIYSIFHPHHLNYALPLLAIMSGFAIDSIPKQTIRYAIILLFLAFAYPILSWYSSRLSSSVNFKIANDVYLGDPMFDTVEWVKKNTNPNDKLMVIGDPLFYMRADRLPSVRPAKSIPYSWEPLDKIKAEIRLTPADYWIIDIQSLKRIREVNNKPKMVDFINEELSGGYFKIATFKTWEVWKLR